MIVRIPDLGTEVRHVEFVHPREELNARIDGTPGGMDPHFQGDATVAGDLYLAGRDVHFQGSIEADLRSVCPRCLDEFEWRLCRPFRFLIVPSESGVEPADDEGIDHYDGDELDLAPLAVEQGLLALDGARLCSDDCRGLCSGCGANLNHEDCGCADRRTKNGSR